MKQKALALQCISACVRSEAKLLSHLFKYIYANYYIIVILPPRSLFHFDFIDKRKVE